VKDLVPYNNNQLCCEASECSRRMNQALALQQFDSVCSWCRRTEGTCTTARRC